MLLQRFPGVLYPQDVRCVHQPQIVLHDLVQSLPPADVAVLPCHHQCGIVVVDHAVVDAHVLQIDLARQIDRSPVGGVVHDRVPSLVEEPEQGLRYRHHPDGMVLRIDAEDSSPQGDMEALGHHYPQDPSEEGCEKDEPILPGERDYLLHRHVVPVNVQQGYGRDDAEDGKHEHLLTREQVPEGPPSLLGGIRIETFFLRGHRLSPRLSCARLC